MTVKTHEELVDRLVQGLATRVPLSSARSCRWGDFGEYSRLVHTSFEVPSTTVSPVMRRLLFALGHASAGTLVGVGTYVGYGFAWLVGGMWSASSLTVAVGIDIDIDANAIARRNFASLPFADRVHFVDGPGEEIDHSDEPVDVLFLDLDDSVTGKSGYTDILEKAAHRLSPGALVVAHDPCVERFAADFIRFHAAIGSSPMLEGPWILPVDSCGITLAVRR